MEAGFTIDVRLYRLSKPLRPHFTALYMFDIVCADEHEVEDCLHPEWTALRFTIGHVPKASIGAAPLAEKWPFIAAGPTSKSMRFSLATSRIWGLGLHPAGWAKFVDVPARDYADRIVDGMVDPAFSLFAPLLSLVQSCPVEDPDQTAATINRYLMRHVDRPVQHESLIVACHDALRHPDIANVGELGEQVGLSARSLERLCARYFGFPPKLLLRRQRFLRSLAGYMLDPALNWCEALDAQYHDQAQFVRDFRSFMGMTPGEYAEAPHPILDQVIAQRMADQGAGPQTDLPTILRYTADGDAKKNVGESAGFDKSEQNPVTTASN